MILGIDASRADTERATGTEHYAASLIQALRQQFPQQDWRFYLRAPNPALALPPEQQRILIAPRLWSHTALSWELHRNPPDAVFIPAHVLPIHCPVPSLVTIHDVGYLHFPAAHPRLQRWYLHASTAWAVRRATHLLADSYATQRDLCEHYRADPASITVVYPGFDPIPFSEGKNQPPLPHLPDNYLLHVGTMQPRKNIARLLQAFVALPDSDLHLVLAGKMGWLMEPIGQQAARLGIGARVHWLEYVPQADLPRLYAHARLFVFPSLYEGFGFPVLEAMAAGVPVLCSDGGSLPEVVGDAAWVLPRLDTHAWTDAIHHLLHDSARQEHYRRLGAQRCQQFQWERAARLVYEEMGRVAGV